MKKIIILENEDKYLQEKNTGFLNFKYWMPFLIAIKTNLKKENGFLGGRMSMNEFSYLLNKNNDFSNSIIFARSETILNERFSYLWEKIKLNNSIMGRIITLAEDDFVYGQTQLYEEINENRITKGINQLKDYICCFSFLNGDLSIRNNGEIGSKTAIGYGYPCKIPMPDKKIVPFCHKKNSLFFSGDMSGIVKTELNPRYQLLKLAKNDTKISSQIRACLTRSIMDLWTPTIQKNNLLKLLTREDEIMFNEKCISEFKPIPEKKSISNKEYFHLLNLHKFSICPVGNTFPSSGNEITRRHKESMAMNCLVISNDIESSDIIGGLRDGISYLSLGPLRMQENQKDFHISVLNSEIKKVKANLDEDKDFTNNYNKVISFILKNLESNCLEKIANNGKVAYNRFFKIENDGSLTKEGFYLTLKRINEKTNGFFDNYIDN